jgi:LysM repeat protein
VKTIGESDKLNLSHDNLNGRGIMKNSDQNNDENFVMQHAEDNHSKLEQENVTSYELEDSYFRKTSLRPYILMGVGFVVLIVLVIIVLSRTRNLPDSERLLELEARIEQLEAKLGASATSGNLPDMVADHQKKIDALNQRMEQLETSISSNMNQIMEQLNTLKPAAASQGSAQAGAGQPAAKKEKALTKTHKVKAGETLYRISKLYGLTVEQLRSYNNLKTSDKIYPGQDLNLSPPQSN